MDFQEIGVKIFYRDDEEAEVKIGLMTVFKCDSDDNLAVVLDDYSESTYSSGIAIEAMKKKMEDGRWKMEDGR